MSGFFDEMYVDGASQIRDHYGEFDRWLGT